MVLAAKRNKTSFKCLTSTTKQADVENLNSHHNFCCGSVIISSTSVQRIPIMISKTHLLGLNQIHLSGNQKELFYKTISVMYVCLLTIVDDLPSFNNNMKGELLRTGGGESMVPICLMR